MKKLLTIAFISCLLPFALARNVRAQTVDAVCIGSSIADYMNTVIDGAKELSHTRLLSPAFNMTSASFDPIVNSMGESGAKFNQLDGIAGNAYNTTWGSAEEFINIARNNNYLKGLPILLTEFGWHDYAFGTIEKEDAKSRLKNSVNYINNTHGVLGALLFNGFGTGGSEWSRFIMQNEEISSENNPDNAICGRNCSSRIGINSAAPFRQDSSFYNKAKNLGMGYTLEIASKGNIDAVKSGIELAINAGLTPVIRIGIGTDSGGFENPNDYVNFLKDINNFITTSLQGKGIVYAIAGPNEPDAENWASPDCKTTQIQPLRNPLSKNFYYGKYACKKTAREEFAPLRPYPANACDPLVPKSFPGASKSSNPPNKYNTLACGTNLIPDVPEEFDPYGDNTYYENLPPFKDIAGNRYRHTWCTPRPQDLKNGGEVTCYRTEPFDITINFTNSNIGILGNTQNPNLTDEQLVNGYLSSYLAGVPQVSDHKLLDPKSKKDMDRLINFSGPLRKLLPQDVQDTLRKTLASTVKKDVHNYLVGEKGILDYRLSNFGGRYQSILNSPYLQNTPLSSLEDTAGEVQISVFPENATSGGAQDKDIVGSVSTPGLPTAPVQLKIKGAKKAGPGR